MNFIMILLQSWIWLFSIPEQINDDHYKIDDSYVIQEIAFNTHPQHHPQFSGLSTILSNFGEYYALDKEELIDAINNNILDLSSASMLVNPQYNIYTQNVQGEYESLRINYTVNLTTFLQLDDTEVYQIGGRFYAIRRLKYAYMENVPLKYLDPQEDILISIDAESLRLFLFVKRVLPTDPEVEKHVWKRKNELNEFWQENIRNGNLTDFDKPF